ncbi:MAG: hypothetical protein E7316_04810 [Clostridiales bacterium]|nr:hypothetical protein [Clostridiales bacterium]
MAKKLTRILLVALCALLFVTSLTFPTTEAKASVYYVNVSSSYANLYVNAESSYAKTIQLSATVSSTSTSDDKSVTWSSTNPSVATVSKTGKVTAKKAGNTKIYATSKANPSVSDYCYVYVYDRQPTSISIPESQITLYTVNKPSYGYYRQDTLSYSYSPYNSYANVTWKSSNPKVATVTQSGKVTALNPGTTLIYCTSKANGSVRDYCRVVVRKFYEVTRVRPNKSAATLYLTPIENTSYSNTITLKPSMAPTNATVKDVLWRSSNTSVASVSANGVVTGKKAGTATITVISRSKSSIRGTMKVTVKNTPFSVIYNKGLLPHLNTIYNAMDDKIPSDIKTKLDSITTAADNLVAICKTHPSLKTTAFTYARRIQAYVDKIEYRLDYDYRPDDNTTLNYIKAAMEQVKLLKNFAKNLSN